MIDYKAMGAQVKKARKLKHMTQEQLAEKVNVGIAHISHIETGSNVPSLQVLVDIANVLDASLDAFLCMDSKHAQPLRQNWLIDLVADCSNDEIKLITDLVIAAKSSMRRLKLESE